MKKYCFLMTAILFLIFSTASYAATTLKILEPRINQHTERGSIQDMSIYVIPQGTYTEVHVYISFNSNGSQWKDITDTLEVVMDFQLDPKAMVTDSYLYMDDGEKVQAMLIDVWSATKIYEDYVRRRTDPSLFRKKSQTDYELRIFPLAGSLFRKAQLNFHFPNGLYQNREEVTIPFEWLNSSYQLPETVSLYFVHNSEFTNPSLGSGFEDITFTPYDDVEYGQTFKAEIPSATAKQLKNIYFNSVLSTNNFLAIKNFDNNKYYQLSIPLSSNFQDVPKQNVCFVLDYEEGKANQNLNDVISALKTSILNYATPGDSFNIVLSGFKPVAVSNKWLPIDSLTVNQIFANVNASSVSTVTHLFEAVDKAMDFINNSKQDAVIYIVSNSDAYGENKVANEFIDHIFSNNETRISISVYSFCNESKCKSYNMSGMTYKANDYLYLNLVKQSKGSSFYKTSNNETPAFSFNKSMPEVMGSFDNFMIYTILEDGYVYNKQIFSDKLGANSRYKEFGMLSGSLPMTIDIGYTFRQKFFNKKVKIDLDDVSDENYKSHTIWAGNMISAKEKLTQTNNNVYQIIEESRKHRVLSIYTAFLALEKTDKDTTTGDPNNDDDGETTFVTDLSGVKLSIGPNPIMSEATINITIPENLGTNIISLKLYDVFGRELKQFEGIDLNSKDISFNWNATDNFGKELPNGVYILVLQIGNNKITMKVVVAR